MTRAFFVWLHRWAGLTIAGFLIVVGLTGSLLAFLPELNRAITPQLYPRWQQGTALDAATIAEKVEGLGIPARITSIDLGESGIAVISVAPRADLGSPHELGFNQIILDRYRGTELGRRTYGAISEGLINLMPFIYRLHDELASGTIGLWVLGVAALVWTLDSFIGFYLTLPLFAARPLPDGSTQRRSWWKRWWISWKVKGSRLNFDLHRAGGLWLWVVLVVFGWSSVYMNLWDTAYTSVTRLFLEYHEPWTDLPKVPHHCDHPRLNWRDAQTNGATILFRAGEAGGFTIGELITLQLDAEHGVYVYQARSSRDVQDQRGMTRVFFDCNSGAEKLLLLPTGQYSGNTLTAWLYALHMANVFGLPYRIFVALLGEAIVMLSITGIIIWVRRRGTRLRRRFKTM